MRVISNPWLLSIPALLALLLLGLTVTPLAFVSWGLQPNVGVLMTLAVAALYPPAWPRWFAFLFGLVQDVLYGTPFGAQALLLVLLVSAGEYRARRGSYEPFPMRWLEAAAVILLWHLLLWAVLAFVTPPAMPPLAMLRVALANALWYPVFHGLAVWWRR